MKNKLFWMLMLCVSMSFKFASAAEIATNMGQFQAMDKITGRVSIVEIPVGGMISFGSFSIVLRACKTRSAEEVPENFAFLDVADKSFGGEEYNIFKGWMFSSSPAVNAVEHPIYDIWLLKCFDGQVDTSKLLSEQALAARDTLPRLNEVVALNDSLQQNTFVTENAKNISFKDEIYKEDITPQVQNQLPEKKDGEPQNLLIIDENYVPVGEDVTLSPEDFARALSEAAQEMNINIEDADIAILEKQLESTSDDSLLIDIDAELKKVQP
ncbi:MAG: DUF2155 domain-containing protein [Alphaproteobacteria bacterium]|nr:DUF2155 domain-containing protein [Alphaproteobacteria bacterium]